MFNLKSVFQGLCSKIFGSDKSNHSSRPILTVPTIRDAALSYDGKFNVQDIVDITGKSRRSIGEILRELRDKNILVKYKDGTWEKVEINPVVINWGIPEMKVLNDAYHARIKNAWRLFGTYGQTLGD